MSDLPGWNLPFEEQDPQPLRLDDGHTLVAGGIVMMGALTETPLGRFPLIVFRFDTGHPGAPMPSVALLMDAGHLRNVPSLVEQAVASAIRKAAGR